MGSGNQRVLGRLLLLADLAVIALSFLLAYSVRFPDNTLLQAYGDHRSHQLLLGISALLAWPLTLQSLGLYSIEHLREPAAVLWKLLQGAVFVGVVTAASVFLLQTDLSSRLLFAMTLGFSVTGLWLLRGVYVPLLRWRGRRAPVRLLVIGAGEPAERLGQWVEDRPALGISVVGFVHTGAGDRAVAPDQLMGGLEDVPRLLDEQIVDQVAFAVPSRELHLLESVFFGCEELGLDIVIVADFFDQLLAQASVELLEGLPVLRLHSSPQFRATMVNKRVLDVVVGLVLLVLTAPVMILTAVGVKVTSRGPILFKQERVGLRSRRFVLYKFRSMVPGAEGRLDELHEFNEMHGPTFKMQDDPRVTPVGRIIRRLSIDELPQLFNVLRGEMSLVGPRPPLPEEVRSYDRWQRRRLSVKPGMTCTWQIQGRNRIDFDEWMRLDLDYIDRWSPWLDLKIILRTVPAVLLGRGAS